MKILITGSRVVMNSQKIYDILDKIINKENDVIIQGGADGVDTYARLWCMKNNVECIEVRPINKNHKIDYLYRNCEMVGMCDIVYAFWDGISRGTKFTIDYSEARHKLKEVFVI